MWKYFIEISNGDRFLSDVRTIRIKYRIPLRGYEWKEKDPSIPDEWYEKEGHEAQFLLKKDVNKICEKYALPIRSWSDTIEFFIFYNKRISLVDTFVYKQIIVSDSIRKNDVDGNEVNKKTVKEYPIAINITPYVGENELVDYIHKMFITEVKPIQERYLNPEIKINKVRAKKSSIKEVKAFVWENRQIKGSDLTKLVHQKFKKISRSGEVGPYTYDDINKMISLERLRRKQA